MSDPMNAHKMAAGAGSTGNFGVKPFPSRAAAHPDASMSHAPMADSARSPAYGNQMGAPDHGMGKGAADHFDRGGKI